MTRTIRSFLCAAFALATLVSQAFDTPYLTFRSESSFNITVYSAKWDGTMEYSTDAVAWTTWTGSSISGELSDGQYRLYLRGTGNSAVSGGSSWSLSGSSDLYCEGDIETLRDYSGNSPAMAANCYKYIFLGWSKLKSAPALSATTLTNECYASMFNGCTSLETAPALPATTLAEKCYQSMFSGCTSLTAAPALPAMTMAVYCYGSMFSGCTSITESPALPATTLADNCYSSMFMGCTGLKTLPVLSATTTKTCSYFQMFQDCSSLVINSTGDPSVAWSIPSLVSAGSIYNYNMFQGTGGDFTGNPVAGTTYYVASALPPGLRQEIAELHAYTGASMSIDLADTIAGGTGEYTFTDTASALSALGLSLSGTTLAGTISTADSYVFTLHVADTTSPDPLTLDAEYTLVVSDPDPFVATQTNLGTVKVGKSASFALADTVSGGVPPYTFAASGSLTSGFTLSNGVLSFTASAGGNYSASIVATDSLGTPLNVTYSIEAAESAGFTDDDPEEPDVGTIVNCLTPGGVFPRTCNQVVNSSTVVTWEDSWYYVTNNVTLSAGATVVGKVSLILCDGAMLSVTGAYGKAGIALQPGNSLTIYSQSAGTGVLSATGGNSGAGIGGNNMSTSANCGKLNIYGGVITAIGKTDAAGIGGGDNNTGAGGIVKIYGGTVDARASGNMTSAIGGGYNGPGGELYVYGGSVTASASSTSSRGGVGSGYSSINNEGSLTVGANVIVKAGTTTPLTDADIKNPNGETSIPLTTKYRYYSFETTGPVPLAQKPGAGALAALVGGEASWTLSDTIAGGEAPYSFEPKSGYEPPAFLTLANGVLSGIPTAAGSWTFTFVVTDDVSDSIEAEYTLTVSAPAALSANGALGNIVKNAAANYNLSTTVSGGIPGYTFALKAGSTLPDGLILENGVISGSPTTAGNYAFTIVVSDSALPTANTIEAEYTLSVKEIYNIVYKNREGTGNLSLVPSTYVEGTGVATLPMPTAAGWVFVSWHYNSNLQDDPVTSIPANATGDKTLYSKWEENLSGIVPMTFIDIDGSSLTTNCTVIDSTTTTLASGWYTVANDITFSSKTLTVAGDVKIVLRDGKTMTITSGENNKAGVSVADGYSLSIYGQSAGTGTLNTKGNWYGAGIGGNNGVKGGTVTINGGTVIATSGKDAAGIGGGLDADGGMVVINGGNVTVTSNNDGAGIGGGKNGAGGTLTVNGGSVSVQGYQYGTTSPGVGGGVGATQHGKLYVGDYVSVMAGNRSNQMTERTPDVNGEIALAGEILFSFASTKPVSVSYLDTDGVVKYTNCVILASSTMQLSNGWYAATSSLSLPTGLTVLEDVKLIIADGATVTVAAGTSYGTAGVTVGAGNSLTIYSQQAGTGVLNATGYDSGAGIGGNSSMACGTVTINGCTVNATGGNSGAGIGGGYTGAGGTIVVNGGEVHATGGGSNTPGIGGGFGSNIAQGTLRVADGLIVKAGASANPEGTPPRDPVTNEITLGKERYYDIVAPDASTEFPIAYMDGETPLNLSPSVFTYGSGLAVLSVPAAAYGFAFDGWYDNDALTGSAVTSIPAGLTTGVTLYAKWKPATVATTFIGADGSQTEDCTVLIAERNALSNGWYVVEGTLDYGTAGITVSGDVNLVLKDGAQLTVAGAMYNAGISVPYGSSLAIYAQSEGEGMGTLSATGGSRGAGIGGGDGVAAGTIAIYGGTVTAQSVGYAAGIGGGYMSDGGDVTINGGVVNATGGTNGAGIGSGPGTTRDNIICSGGTVTINGGSVTATGGANGAGIGGGQVGNGATVVVNGGTVSATGGDDSQMPIPSCGIGCGFGSNLSYGTLAVDAAMAVRAGLSANPAAVLVRNAETGAVTLGGQHCFAIATAQTFGIVYMDGENEIAGLLPDEYVEGAGVDLPGKNDVVKDGWSFQGWYSDSTLEIGPVFAVPPTVSGTQTFCAKFIEGGETELVRTESELDGVSTGVTINHDLLWTIDGGIAPYAFAVKAGTRLPPGLKLSGSTISGVLADAGTYNFTITVTDSTGPVAQSIDAAYTLVATGEHAGPLFSINDAGTLIASHPRGNVSVVIPDTVRGISVKALGAGLFKDCDYLESVTIPSGVTNIMNGAFENCTAMPSVTLPASLERIDSRAFYGCTALVGVTIPSGVREIGVLAFNECTALASISIPGSVATIGADAFDGCTALASVTFANGVETIGSRAFMDCAGLTSVVFPDSVTTIGESAFSRCYGITSVTLGDGVATIGDTAFNSCTNLSVLTFGTSLATIGEGAFFGCESLVGDGVNVFYIPDGVTSIGDVAFRGTSIEKASLPGDLYEEGAPADGAFSLTARVMYRTDQVVYHTRSNGLLWAVDLNGNTVANIPSSVKEIGPAAFEGCDSVVTVTVPSSVNNISTRAFYGCSSLASVNVPYGVLSIGGQAFASCTNLTSISIPDATTQIGNGVFWGCSSLESVTLGTGVTEIPDFAFKDCESLATVTMGGDIESIGTLAFENCSALTEISLPSSLTTIGSWAFENCTSLAELTIPRGVTIGLSAFAHCTGLVSVNISGEVKRRTKKMSLRLSAAAPTTLLGTSNPDATTVGGYAFYGCDALEDVVIGATVEDIGGGAFSGCRSIRSMDVEAGNDNYMSVDGLFLTKDGATLISAFGNETEITVPNSVVTIETGAFAGYLTLTNVVLQSGVETIGEAAFSNATAFATITIPSTVTTIGANAFCGTALATVNVAKDDTARVKALVEGTGYAAKVAYVEPGSEPAGWPADTSEVAAQTAAEAFGITEGPLTNVNAKALADWAKDPAKGNVGYAEMGSIIPEAFLLDCANTAAAVEEAAEVAVEAIRITAISFDSEGNPVLTHPATYGNGTVVLQGKAALGSSSAWHDGKQAGDHFFRTELRLQ